MARLYAVLCLVGAAFPLFFLAALVGPSLGLPLLLLLREREHTFDSVRGAS